MMAKLGDFGQDERGHNLIADFVERVWEHAGGEDYSVSFVPTLEGASLWVSGRTRKVVAGVLDETIDRLRGGFEQSGEIFEVKQTQGNKQETHFVDWDMLFGEVKDRL